MATQQNNSFAEPECIENGKEIEFAQRSPSQEPEEGTSTSGARLLSKCREQSEELHSITTRTGGQWEAEGVQETHLDAGQLFQCAPQ